MRGMSLSMGCGLLALLVALPSVQAEEKGDFEWSWSGEGAPPATPATPAADTTAAGTKLDPDTYNQLLKENLTLRRKLQDTDRGAEAIREENANLQRDMSALQAKITDSSEEIDRLKRASSGADPEKIIELETGLAAAESAKAKLAQDLATLKSRMQRTAAAPVETAKPAGRSVKPGSDLFVSLEGENAELRDKLSTLESEKQKVVKQLRAVEAEVDANAGLEAEMASVSGETTKQKKVIRKLLDRIPELEKDLAATQSRERETSAELSERDREMRTLKAELERREKRLKKAERVAMLLAKTRTEVNYVGTTRQRDMHYNMGVVFANRGQFKEAEREYLRALRQDPADADTHYNLGVLYDQSLKEYRKAASHYRRYLKLRPQSPDANEVRIWITAAETK
ncbi:MAG: tetratricopeptide repeat protein [Verrucomicrobia bacterium]|jgi:tetratricopeptide (TPR) repeat protein|nr:tetratricopeptide repeat protein [Verrucomicrobiota bacterium]MBT7066297.1 tetratricopeptide repeat protein [Verrucomicrobiota bacterium]MBT7699663.1 tetratricopeptide repeat protein [Verrucomicrobiota bacterium]